MKAENKRGFTLVELLVAMSIVTVLSAVTIPAYRNMRVQARTAEAKTHLSTLYLAEKSFFMQYGCYTSDVLVLGLKPEGELLYNVGFAMNVHGCSSNYNGPTFGLGRRHFHKLCGDQLADGHGALGSACGFHFKGQSIKAPSIPGKPITCITQQASKQPKLFKAAAIGAVKNPVGYDDSATGHLKKTNIWTINQHRIIKEVRDIHGKEITGAAGDSTMENNCTIP